MNSNTKDIRTRPVDLQVRDLDNGAHEISGYAVVFNQPSVNMGFIEYISPHALDNVDLSQLMLLYGHDFNQILARADSQTLSTKIDETGLFFVAQLPDTTLGNDVFTDIQNGNIKGCSFRFDVKDGGDEWQEDKDGVLIHTINALQNVPEISLVTLPAYQETSVQIQRSLDTFKKEANNLKKKNTREAEPTKDEETVAPKEAPKEAEEKGTDLPDFSALLTQLQQVVDALAKPKEEEARAENEEVKDADDTPEEPEDTDSEDEVRSLPTKEETPQVKTIKSTAINNDDKAPLRGFADYVKSHGSTRDNITTNVEGAVLVPKQILNPQQVPEDSNVLTSLVNRVAVTSPAGSIPIIKKGTARFTTKEELAKNPELAKMGIAEVDYQLKTFAGAIPISNEMLSDYAQINSIVAQYLNNMRSLTEQDKIGAILAKATAVSATDADGIKDAVNIGLSNYNNKTFVVTESAYAFIDKLKDGNGRYLFEDSIAAKSGKSLLGYPVVTVPDTVLGGGAKAFYGDLRSFVLETYKDESSIKWVDNDLYGQKLAAYIRADFQAADADAGKLITLGAPAPKPNK